MPPGPFAKGDATGGPTMAGVARRDIGFEPKSGVSFQSGILLRKAAGTGSGEAVDLRGGGGGTALCGC